MKLLAIIKRIRLVLSLILFTASATGLKAQVTIGSNNAPNSNAVLDLISNTNKGLLLPRVALTSTTSASPLSSHVAGMLVYNTATSGSGLTAVSPGIYYNNGSVWMPTIASSTNIYNSDGTLASNRVVTMDGKTLSFNGGNVGIGTASPSSRLYVLGVDRINGDSSAFQIDQKYKDLGDNNLLGSGTVYRTNNGVSTWNLGSVNGVVGKPGDIGGYPGGLAFYTKGNNGSPSQSMSEQMRIDYNGNVGIGTSSPNYKLHVNGDVGAYNCISDVRLKKDIKPLEVDNKRVLGICPVTYKLKEDPQQLPRIGVIAQELETLFPDLVKTDQNGYKAVEYDKISLLLLSVVKQQQKDIEQMKIQLKKLEEKAK